ncbi:MAG: DNA polymerase III subunit gamma/tau [Candidatus Omnitrophota bacterium]|nr:DNA polymerase III subunit gamma/tau [Candidatus Omnitrophota bacterium]
MSYIVFARKYRPQAFDEVVGQSHITTTLENAIAQDRVAHAYIFAGPRGVGKTTTARIFAKALNCERGPTADPCNKCPLCLEITQGSSLDILEIDGASNRGIDEIRNLRENVKFSPSKGRFKVYIIDEVHMLTQEAFNALLKTLEEPPAHVKFIFATTQAHKVPPTILSRCQRFDFRRISIKDIVDSLKAIAKKENLKVEDDVLILMAKHSDGSMRDAQVVLDQISSFADGRISLEDASKILGAVSDDILFSLADSIKSRDALGALKIIDDLANEGKDVAEIVLYLIEHFRDLSVE